MKSPSRLLCALAFVATGWPSQAAEMRVLTWNIESDRPDDERRWHFADGNSPTVICRQLESLQSRVGGYDLIGLTEVRAENAGYYERAVEASGRSYTAILSKTYDTDRLLIFVNESRFEILEEVELVAHGGVEFPGEGARQPIYVRVKDQQSDGREFIFMVNHLSRGDAEQRRLQARLLRDWAAAQKLPIVGVGDYNFDFDFRTLTGNQAMSIFGRDDRGKIVWRWVIPSCSFESKGSLFDRRVSLSVDFVDTNWSDGNDAVQDEDRADRYPGSLLDFVFVAQGAQLWEATSSVIVREGDFPDSADTSDHRPVEATLNPTP